MSRIRSSAEKALLVCDADQFSKALLQPITEHRARVFLPNAMAVKQPAAAESWEWFWLFPGNQLSLDPRTGCRRRHHLHEVNVSRELVRAAKMAALTKRATEQGLAQNVWYLPLNGMREGKDVPVVRLEGEIVRRDKRVARLDERGVRPDERGVSRLVRAFVR